MKKIVHLCLANFYVDGYAYQENILPREHKALGYDVEIIASTETFINNERLGYVKPSVYINEDGIRVTRLPYLNFAPLLLKAKVRTYSGLLRALKEACPDLLFVHDVQFFDALKVRWFVERNSHVAVYADCHADFSNSARSFLSREILHKLFYRFCAKQLDKVAQKFWGTLPVRSEFLRVVYKLPKDKIALLEMGVEQRYIDVADRIRESKYGSLSTKRGDSRLDLVTGGKIDAFKSETISLIDAVSAFDDKVKLTIFGSVSKDLRPRFDKALEKSKNVKFVGWLTTEQSCLVLAQADLAIFPGRHSVLWEQCVGMGVPVALKKWPKMHHLDIGGNVIWLHECSIDEVQSTINKVLNHNYLEKLRLSALKIKRERFSYRSIALRSIDRTLSYGAGASENTHDYRS